MEDQGQTETIDDNGTPLGDQPQTDDQNNDTEEIEADETPRGSGRTECSENWLERTLSDALRITWCIEAPWWVKKGVFAGASVKPGRFLEEIVWVGEWWR